jgi:hypothetical protein
LVAVALVAGCALQPNISWANSKQGQWPVRYVAGSKKSQGGAKVDLLVSKEAVRCRKGKNIVLEIPAASITEVGYDDSSHNRGWTWLKAGSEITREGKCSGLGCGAATVLIGTPVVVGAVALAPFKSTQHFVRVLWQENGEPSEALFEVGKEDYAAVLTAFQDATGKPWQDLPVARKKLLDEIKAAQDRRIPVQLDRAVVLNEAEMKVGRYQLIVLERPDNLAEAYFFAGEEVEPEHVIAQALAKVGISTPPAANPSVTYAERMGAATIATLQVQDKNFEFMSAGLPARVNQSVRSFYGGGNKWAVVTRADFHGDPALRFRVIHNPFPHVCQEFIYVTRTHVASEIAPNSPQTSCATFSALRAEVKAVAYEGKWINHFMGLTVGDKTYGFQPIFEEAGGQRAIAGLGRTRDAARDYAAFFVQAVTDFDEVEAPPKP